MALKRKPFFPPFINDIYLMLTERCPMRCEYCYIKHRADGESMTRETMGKVMERVTGRPRVIFFGGEPLLKVDEMEWFIDKYKDRCCGFQTVTSMAVNFDDFYRRIYEPNKDNFDLQLSWDGMAGTRKLAGGINNSSDTYEKIEFMLHQDGPFQVRTVINDTNVDDLFRLYSKYRGLTRKHDNFCADMTLAHQESYDDSFPQKLEAALKQILALIEFDIKSHEKPYIEQWILTYFASAINNNPIMGCNVGAEIIIRPNGDIYPCTMLSQCGERFKMGNIYDNAIDTSILESLVKQPDGCKDCSLKKHCMGGCRYEKIARTGDLDIVNPCYCEQARVIIPTVLSWLGSIDDDVREVVYAYVSQFLKWKACAESEAHKFAYKFRAKEVQPYAEGIS